MIAERANSIAAEKQDQDKQCRAARSASLRRIYSLLDMVLFKISAVPHMRKLLMNSLVSAAACILTVTVGASPVNADALPDAETNVPAASNSAASPSSSGAASTAAVSRQHVRHLKAHKKPAVDALTDTSQDSDKAEVTQSSRGNPEKADAGQKASVDNPGSFARAKPAVKPSKKISRPQNRTIPATPGSRTGTRVVRDRDFLSDIFGGDE